MYTNTKEFEQMREDISDRDRLIVDNIPFVIFIAKRYVYINPDIDIEDLISVGTIGLIKAIDTYNQNRNRNASLNTYAGKCIKNEILMYIKKANKHSKTISFEDPIFDDGSEFPLTIEDIIADDKYNIERHIEWLWNRDITSTIIKELEPIDRQLIYLRYGFIDGECKTQEEVGNILGYAQSYISRKERIILNKLNKLYKKYI